MEHLTKDGASKLVAACSYPLTGRACVSRIYTDLAVVDIDAKGFIVTEIIPGLSFEELLRLSAVPLRDGRANRAAA